MRSKSYEPRKVKTLYNLKWREYIDRHKYFVYTHTFHPLNALEIEEVRKTRRDIKRCHLYQL
jgi:hypothetical protein